MNTLLEAECELSYISTANRLPARAFVSRVGWALPTIFEVPQPVARGLVHRVLVLPRTSLGATGLFPFAQVKS